MSFESKLNQSTLSLACMSLRKDKSTFILKSLVVIICWGLFFANTYPIFIKYASKNTIIASNTIHESRLLLPAIVLCNASGYKNPELSNSDIKEYINNTVELSDILIAIATYNDDPYGGPSTIHYNLTYQSPEINVDPILTNFRGRCYKFTYTRKVFHKYMILTKSNIERFIFHVVLLEVIKYYQLKEQEPLVFVVKRESGVRINLLEPGQELFMYYEFWPRTVPNLIRHENGATMHDVSIEKEQKILHKDCKDEQEECYLGKNK